MLKEGQDVEAEVEVTLAEAYQGVTRTFELTAPDGGSPSSGSEDTCGSGRRISYTHRWSGSSERFRAW